MDKIEIMIQFLFLEGKPAKEI